MPGKPLLHFLPTDNPPNKAIVLTFPPSFDTRNTRVRGGEKGVNAPQAFQGSRGQPVRNRLIAAL